MQREVKEGLSFRAVVADCFYGENPEFVSGLQGLQSNGSGKGVPVGFVLSLKRSHCWWHADGEVGSLLEAAQAASWDEATKAGDWEPVVRTFADGHEEIWYALEVQTRFHGPEHLLRAVVVTTDPALLPEVNTWFLMTNLPAPNSSRVGSSSLALADLEAVVRLYSLRNWVEQSYKQVKQQADLLVEGITADTIGSVHFSLTCGYSLDLRQGKGLYLPIDSLPDVQWRFMARHGAIVQFVYHSLPDQEYENAVTFLEKAVRPEALMYTEARVQKLGPEWNDGKFRNGIGLPVHAYEVEDLLSSGCFTLA